jgi:hypothetical protein
LNRKSRKRRKKKEERREKKQEFFVQTIVPSPDDLKLKGGQPVAVRYLWFKKNPNKYCQDFF